MTTSYVSPLMINRVAAAPANFVGRESELVLIQKQPKATKGDHVRAVLLTRRPDIGKTRLL